MKTANEIHYGNWVANRLIIACAAITVMMGSAEAALCMYTSEYVAVKIVVAVLAAVFAGWIVYFLYARRLFSPEGGDIQNKVLDLLVDRIDWDGEGTALDIGCGSGALVVKIAQKYPQSTVTGLDFWGAEWGYAKSQCETNAALEGVKFRTEFVKGSASELPFDDDTFDLVVSNMTFHEVKEARDKVGLIREALRVLKPGGQFVFQDLFLLKSYYGTPDQLTAATTAAGAQDAHFENTSAAPFIPKSLKLSFMLGAMGMLYGKK